MRRMQLVRDAVRRADGGGATIATAADPPTQIDVGDTQVLGVSPFAAHADHQHACPDSGAPSSIDIGDASSVGVATTPARSDHMHPVPAPAGAPPAVAAAGAVGTATTPARSDHTHAGVTSVEGAGGAITIVSPMKSVAGGVVTLANGNNKDLPGGFVTNDIDTDANTSFKIPKLGGSVTVPIPKAPTGNVEDRRISFKVISRGTSADVVTWTGGAGGFSWPTQLGPLLADFNATLAAAPNDAEIKVGCNWSVSLGKWLVTSLAGYFT
jgi:hypothetical protein